MTTSEIVQIVIAIVEITIGAGLIKFFLDVRDNLKRTDRLEKDLHNGLAFNANELNKFKEEVRGKLSDNEKEIEDTLDGVNRDILTIEKAMSSESKSFTEILAKINLTLVRLDTSVQNLNQLIVTTEERTDKIITRLYKDFDDLKSDTKERIASIKIR